MRGCSLESTKKNQDKDGNSGIRDTLIGRNVERMVKGGILLQRCSRIFKDP